MCLLIALFGVLADTPLMMAANRDERYDRPTEVITVLRGSWPRVLGGRDAVAGGTWLAVNEHGVVAGLTNQPSAAGRDDTRRSRGELPLAFAAHDDAATAVAKVCADLDPSDYNPCWLLVGDRPALFSVDMTRGHHPLLQQLPPGTYVLENAPLPASSAKARQVAALVAAGIAGAAGVNGGNGDAESSGVNGISGDAGAGQADDALAAVLRDHRPAPEPAGQPGTGAAGRVRPAQMSAACVHTGGYGTRSAMIVSVGTTGRPLVQVADGPPCQAPFQDVTGLWSGPVTALHTGLA